MDLRRFLLRSSIVAAACAPALTLALWGCETTEFDDLCAWLRDPNNCYREFFVDIGTRCGSTGPRPGSFAGRDKLGECYLEQGGVIQFEPPLDVTKLPGESEEGLKIKMLNPDATTCGEIEFAAKYDFSISIEGDPKPDAGDVPEELVEGGKFSMRGGAESEALATTCPKPQGGAVYNFDRLQITKCRELEPLLPHAEIDWNPGGVEAPGIIRLRIYYPPIEGELEGATPQAITYFECAIPPAPPVCANGVQDGAETDVDCGGSFCEGKCGDGQKCIVDDDCASDNCAIVMGLSQCLGP